jgi:ABC-2 type transport system permease protein
MRKIIAIAWNDLKLEFSERSSLVFFLVLPMVFTWVIGLAMQGMVAPDENPDPRTPLVVVNEDSGSYALDLIALMNESEIMRVEEKETREGLRLFSEEQTGAYLLIPADFSARIAAGKVADVRMTLNPKFSETIQLKQAVIEALEPINRAAAIAYQSLQVTAASTNAETSFAARYQEALTDLKQSTLTSAVVYREQPRSNLQLTSSFQLTSPGQLVTWVLVSLSGTSVLFVNERKYGTLRRLLITPTTRAALLTGKVLGRVGMGIAQMLILIFFGRLVLQVDWGSAPLALLLVMVSFSFTGTALGILLGTLSKTASQASGLSTLFSMLLASLGGAWWPLEITPKIYQQVVQILPSTWAMQGFNRIILGGQGVQGVLLPCGILWGFTLVFFMISVWKLKFE